MKKGDRVKIHPATDLFMRGERFATVEKIGSKLIHCRGERSGRVFHFAVGTDLLEVVE